MTLLKQQEPEEQLTVTAGLLAQKIFETAEPELHEPIKLLVDAGMRVLFVNEESHHAIFDGINLHDEVPISEEIAVGAVHLVNSLFQETRANAPPEALILAGEILIAKVYEFIDKTEMAPVTDSDFVNTVEMFRAAMLREAETQEQVAAGPQGNQTGILRTQEEGTPI